ncbi:hypothetical protein F8388_011833 [Cannabis sativa]|uniref:RNase H type-1 domain-containing protein n=1 Tax=Cannabis sativa TaxID=3483 RepID=A0A7J6F021_CANSA|nr:hypothetical protein F8388_011833 [Cannabis sativa]
MSWNEERVRQWFNERDSRNILNIGLATCSKPTGLLEVVRTNPIGIGRFYGILLSMGGALCIFKVIWEARNEVVHGTRLRPIMEVINSVNRLYNDHLSRWKSNANKRVNKRITEVGWWNCCTDVSIQPNQSFGAAVFRDHMDRIVAIYSERFSTTNPTLAEATILASAAEFARVNLKGKVVFYCDNKVVVANCSNICNTNQNIDIKGVADRFKSTVRLLDDFKLRKIDRNCNFMAHNSAKWAASVSALGVLDLGTMDANIFSNVRNPPENQPENRCTMCEKLSMNFESPEALQTHRKSNHKQDKRGKNCGKDCNL